MVEFGNTVAQVGLDVRVVQRIAVVVHARRTHAVLQHPLGVFGLDERDKLGLQREFGLPVGIGNTISTYWTFLTPDLTWHPYSLA